MRWFVFKETTVELPALAGRSLEEDALIKLVFHLNDQEIYQISLLRRKSIPRTWSADDLLIVPEYEGAYTVFIVLEVGSNDHQLLGWLELRGPQLDAYCALGMQIDHENVALRARVEVMTADDVFRLAMEQGKALAENNGIISLLGAQALEYQQNGDLKCLQKAIARVQSLALMIPEENPNKPLIQGSLGTMLLLRFQHLGHIEDIDEAITNIRTAVNLMPIDHARRPVCMCDLGTALHNRFKRSGNVADIDNALAEQQAAVNLCSNDDPNRPFILNSYGNTLHTRFKHRGNTRDMDEAIELLQEAVNLSPPDHPYTPDCQTSFGNALQSRFKRFKNIDDIDRAIKQHQAAVKLTPVGHPKRPDRLSNLGNSLQTRFSHFILILRIEGNLKDIEDAVSRHKEAVQLIPIGHPKRSDHLTNLGNSLRLRFACTGTVDDIDKSIAQQKLSVNLMPNDNPRKPNQLSNLGNSFYAQFARTGDVEDVNKSIELFEAALSLSPDVHPNRSDYLRYLGDAYFERGRRFNYQRDSETAISHYSVGAGSSSSPPSARLQCAQSWISAASSTQHASLLAACECAVSIIPLVAWLGLSVTNRHQHLARIGGTVRVAAASAISLQHYDKAVEWLEQGRSIVWNQILQLRTPVDQLRDVKPELADQLVRISRMLDGGVQQMDGGRLSREEEGRRYRALAEEWEATVKKIRELPDFKDFLRPLKLSRLLGTANNGPVVVLNIAQERCDALALIDGREEVMHIPLPDFTFDKATKLQDNLRNLLKTGGIRTRAIKILDPDLDGDGGCRKILAELWNCVVKPVMDSLTFSPHPDTLPRIWWCVTGPLAFLPIHAAGIYDDESGDEQIANYVISSYIPTLSALLESSKTSGGSPFKMLSVIEPSTGGWYIPNTMKELEHIRRRLGTRDHVVLEGPEATKARTTKAMKDCNWLHLACHGSQNTRNPTNSSLKLRDGDLTLEEIIKLDLPQAEFTFLSACQTTTGDETLSDESAHIAGGMLLAGYRSVVATMWSIEDKLAPEVADEFYCHLMGGEERPDSRKAAEALHLSVQKLRRKPGIQMVQWIPFVHLGV